MNKTCLQKCKFWGDSTKRSLVRLLCEIMIILGACHVSLHMITFLRYLPKRELHELSLRSLVLDCLNMRWEGAFSEDEANA